MNQLHRTMLKRSKSVNDAQGAHWKLIPNECSESSIQPLQKGSHINSSTPKALNGFTSRDDILKAVQSIDERLEKLSNDVKSLRAKSSGKSTLRLQVRKPNKGRKTHGKCITGRKCVQSQEKETQTEIEIHTLLWENLKKYFPLNAVENVTEVPNSAWKTTEKIKDLKAVIKSPFMQDFAEGTDVKSYDKSKDIEMCLHSLLFKNHHNGLSKGHIIDWRFNPVIESSRSFEEFVDKKLSFHHSVRHGENEVSTSTTEPTHSMNLELVRLETFKNFPVAAYVSTIKLAKEGFYFTGDGDRVVCFACGSERSRWKADDIPREIHRQISPNCPLLQAGPSNNVPIGDIPNGASTDQHIENPSQSRNVPNGTSSENTNQSNANNEGAQRDRYVENVNSNASGTLPESATSYRDNATVISNGAFSTTNTPRSALLNGSSQASSSKPSSENGASASPKKTDEHRHSTETEANTVHSRSRNIQEKINAFLRDLDPLGINFERPKYPAYAVLATRVSSYKDWPTSLTQTPRDLATAGFLYAGYGDYTRCFFCGGGLRNWEPGDDPWTEHARWFPKCAFLRQNKGDEFVALVQIEHQEEEELETQGAGNITTRSLQHGNVPNGTSHVDISSFSSVQSVLEMGYSLAVIKEAFNQLKGPKDPQDITGEDLMDFILTKEERNNGLDIPPQIYSSRPQAGEENIQGNSSGQQNGNETSQADHTMPSSAQQVPHIAAANGHSMESKDKDVPMSRNEENLDSLNDILPSMSLEDTKSLIEENRRLKDLRLCKICLENEASIAMLPCGHLCCCPDCAPAMRKCPICRQFVKGTVRTWLA